MASTHLPKGTFSNAPQKEEVEKVDFPIKVDSLESRSRQSDAHQLCRNILTSGRQQAAPISNGLDGLNQPRRDRPLVAIR